MANPHHIDRLKDGVEKWNAWRLSSHEEPALGGANLKKAKLSDANLGGANLDKAKLRDADLEGANLDCRLRRQEIVLVGPPEYRLPRAAISGDG
jgi:hypothetical protein